MADNVTRTITIKGVTIGLNEAAQVVDNVSKATSGLQSKLQNLTAANDELTRAGNRLALMENTVLNAFQAGNTITDAHARALDNLRTRYDSLAKSAQAAAAAQSRAADIAAYGQEMDRLRAKFVPLFAAGQQYKSTLAEIGQAAKVGAISEIERASAVEKLKTSFVNQVNAIRGVKTVTDEHTASMGLNRSQMMELSHVARSLFDSIAAGASPLRALSMEGARVAQVFTEGQGGVGGTLKAIGGMVGGLLTGWVGLGVGIVGAMAAGGAAVLRFQTQQDQLARSLNGVGRAAGVSLGGLTQIANSAAARNPGLGQGGATSAAATFAAAGVPGSIMPAGIDAAVRFSRTTGEDMAKSNELWAKALANPLKGMDELNQKLGFLDDATKQHIESLAREGDLLGAQQELLTKSAASMQGMADQTWRVADAWEKIKNAVSGAFSATGGAISNLANGPTTSQRLTSLYAEREGASSFSGAVPFYRSAGRGNPAALDNQILGLNYQLYGETRGASDSASRDAAAKAADARAAVLSQQIGDAVRKALPDVDKAKELDDTLKLLTDALKNPDALAKVQGGASAVSQAAANIQNMRANADPMQRLQQDSALAIQAAQAQTLAEHAAVDARRAELQVLRESGDQLRATTAAEAARNLALAEAQRQIDEYNKGGLRAARDAQLTPYQRGLQRIQDEYDDFTKRTGGGVGAFTPSGVSAGNLSAATAGSGGGGDAIVAYIRQAAISRGIDPDIAIRVARSEGLNNYVGDNGSSFGPFQLHYGGVAGGGNAVSGLGDAFTRSTGLNARDPSTVNSQIDYALDQAKRGGWGPWHGAQAAGIGDWQGIGGASATARTVTTWADVQRDNAQGSAWIAAQGANDNKSGYTGNAQPGLQGYISGYKYEQMQGPLRDANQALDAQIALFQKQSTTADHTKMSLQAMAEEQKLVNEYNKEAVPISDDLQAKLDAYGHRVDAFVKQQEQQQNLVKMYDDLRQSADGFLNTWIGGVARGETGTKAFRAAMEQLGQSLISKGVGGITDMLFGKQGSPGLGLFGALLGGGGGQPMQLSGAVGGASGGGGIGGLIGSLFNGLFHLADGGIMSGTGAVPLRRFADGGIANSPQLAMFGEGSGPEAFIPLKNGGIPVVNAGGGRNAPTVIQGGDLHVHGSIDSASLTEVRAMMAEQTRQMNQMVQRNSGAISGRFNSRYSPAA